MKERTIRIISEIKDDPCIVNTISDSAHLMDDIGLTSLDMMKLFLEIEEEFDVEIDIDDISLDIFESLNHLCDFISNLLQKKSCVSV